MAKVRKVIEESKESVLSLIAKDFKDLDTIGSNLDITKYIRTDFPPFNRATVIGGLPIGCIGIVHGPSKGGKSTFCIGLLASIAKLGHFGVFVDAEYAATKLWFSQLGLDSNDILFYRPRFLEHCVNLVDHLIKKHDEMRENGKLAHDKVMVIVVDSINKLVPQKEFELLMKDGAEALDKRLSQRRGLLLNAWFDHVSPRLGNRNMIMLCIAQERKEEKKNLFDPSPGYRVKGFQGSIYDATVQFRIELGEIVKEKLEFKGKLVDTIVGQAHKIYIEKNKIGYPREKGKFFTSNGKGIVPIGFDWPRTIFTEIKDYSELFTQKQAWYYYNEHKWNGENQFIKYALDHPELLDELKDILDGV